jgi:hypothetical protein
MVQILPRNPTKAGELLTQGFAKGLPQGISEGLGHIKDISLVKAKARAEQAEKRKIFGSIFNKRPEGRELLEGQGSTDENNDQMSHQESPSEQDLGDLPFETIAELSAIDPEMGSQFLKIKESARAERKQSDEYVQGILQGYESARVSKANLARMRKLEQGGELAGPYSKLISQATGIPISILGNPKSEEFEKLVSQRGLNVAQAYGFGRILQTEYENFLKTIPTLMNSQEGRKRIGDTLEYFDNIAEARYNTLNQIMKQNGGRRPQNLQEQVTARMAPYYDKAEEVLVYGSELINMISPDGKKGKVPKNEIEEALKEGYKLESTQ